MIAYLNGRKIKGVEFLGNVTATPEVETVIVEKIAGFPTTEELANEYLGYSNYKWSDSNFLLVPSGQYVCTQDWQNVYFNTDSHNWEAQKRTDGSDYCTYNYNNIEELRNCLTFSGETYKMLCETSDVATNEWGKYDVTQVKNLNLNQLEETDISGNTNSYLVDYNHNYNIYENDEWGNENQKSFYNPYNNNEYSTFYAAYKEDKRCCRLIYISQWDYMENVDKIEYANIIWDSDDCGTYELDGETLTLSYTTRKAGYSYKVGVKKHTNVICNNTLVKEFVYIPATYTIANKVVFYPCVLANGFDQITIKNPDTPLTSAMGMFGGCSGLTSIKNLEQLDTSNVTNMSGMFSDCIGLTSLDLSNFNTSAVTYMQEMFYNCNKMKFLNLGNLNTSNVTTTSNMFSNMTELRQLIWNNMANGENVTQLSFISSYYLGEETMNDNKYITDLRNTFVINSFDRASAGYSTCTLSLQQHTKDKFTGEEIAEITSKGFTIA